MDWFAPAADLLRARRDFFAPDAPVLAARAPGRLDVMGGIADYSGALVLELPLHCATFALLQRDAERRCVIASRRASAWRHFTLDLDDLLTGAYREPAALGAFIAERESDRWPAYVLGVVQWCLQHGGRGSVPFPGFRILLDSTVPEGKGVASSAALEVAVMTAVVAALDRALPPTEVAAVCQWVENHVVGAPCGIMDQMTSACGRQGRLLRLRCQPGTVEGHVAVPDGYRFYGIDSGVRHAVTGADYGTVRTAAFMGSRIIREAGSAHGYLANIRPATFAARFEASLPERMSGAEFLARFGGTSDPVTTVVPERIYPVRAATRHPVREQQRVERFATLLQSRTFTAHAARKAGALMRAAHESYSACGLGSAGTDRLVEVVAAVGEARGLYGAKITGGGSGGTVAILGTTAAEPEVRRIAEAYAKESGLRAEVFAESGPGAAETGVVQLGGSR